MGGLRRGVSHVCVGCVVHRGLVQSVLTDISEFVTIIGLVFFQNKKLLNLKVLFGNLLHFGQSTGRLGSR